MAIQPVKETEKDIGLPKRHKFLPHPTPNKSGASKSNVISIMVNESTSTLKNGMIQKSNCLGLGVG